MSSVTSQVSADRASVATSQCFHSEFELRSAAPRRQLTHEFTRSYRPLGHRL